MNEDRERPRRSWREIDQRRDGAQRRDEPRPRGPRAEARSKRATEQYLKQLDGLFSQAPGGAEGEKLGVAVREAHGSSELTAACAAYREALGDPRDAALAALFLDAEDLETVRSGLRGLVAARESGELDGPSAGLRSQLRMLAEHADDEVAELAEALLGDD